MATVDIKNLKNQVVGKLDLSDDVFSGPVNEGLLNDAVKQYLVSQGIPEGRMNVVSFGEERPECRQTTEDCFARNRRAAFALN